MTCYTVLGHEVLPVIQCYRPHSATGHTVIEEWPSGNQMPATECSRPIPPVSRVGMPVPEHQSPVVIRAQRVGNIIGSPKSTHANAAATPQPPPSWHRWTRYYHKAGLRLRSDPCAIGEAPAASDAWYPKICSK